MPIDPNIALQYRPATELLQPMDLVQKAAQLKRMNQQNEAMELEQQKSAALKNAYQNSFVAGKDGAPQLDQNKFLQQYAGIDPQGAMVYQNQMKVQDAAAAQRQLDNQFRERELYQRMLDRKEARDERRFQNGIRIDEKVQGLKTPYGLANTTDDAKQLKEAHESKQSFDSKIDEMIKLRQDYGTEYWNREAVARGKQLSKDLLLEYKNMAKLGVLSKSDEDIINAIIPEDILGHSMGAPGQDPILSNLQKFKSDKDKDFQSRVSTRTRAGIDTAAQKPQSSGNPDLSYLQKFSDENLEKMDEAEIRLLYKQYKGGK